MSVLSEFREAMQLVASKRVSSTDKNKGAYVPDRHQRAVLLEAGFQPVDSDEERLIQIRIGGTPKILPSTYYGSVRAGSGRNPEPRMGRGIISWVDVGDVLWMGTDGQTVFVLKENALPEEIPTTLENQDDESQSESMVNQLFSNLSLNRLLSEVHRRGRRPSTSFVYERDPAIKTFAKLRSQSRCEMPGCDYVGFEKNNGELYIEVHHIVSLAAEGGDIISNVAALCPNCHRKAHYSAVTDQIRETLLTAIAGANNRFRDRNGLV